MNEHGCVPTPFYLQQAKGWIWPIGSYLLNHGLQCEKEIDNEGQRCGDPCYTAAKLNRVPRGFGDLAEVILKSQH